MKQFETVSELESFISNPEVYHQVYYLVQDIEYINKKRSFLDILFNRETSKDIYYGYKLYPCVVKNIHNKVDITYWTPDDIKNGSSSNETVYVQDLYRW